MKIKDNIKQSLKDKLKDCDKDTLIDIIADVCTYKDKLSEEELKERSEYFKTMYVFNPEEK